MLRRCVGLIDRGIFGVVGPMRAKVSCAFRVRTHLARTIEKLRTEVSRIPGMRFRGETLNGRRVRDARSARPGRLADDCPAGLINRLFSRDGRLMDSSPGVTFLRPIRADKMPMARRKPRGYIRYRARL